LEQNKTKHGLTQNKASLSLPAQIHYTLNHYKLARIQKIRASKLRNHTTYLRNRTHHKKKKKNKHQKKKKKKTKKKKKKKKKKKQKKKKKKKKKKRQNFNFIYILTPQWIHQLVQSKYIQEVNLNPNYKNTQRKQQK